MKHICLDYEHLFNGSNEDLFVKSAWSFFVLVKVMTYSFIFVYLFNSDWLNSKKLMLIFWVISAIVENSNGFFSKCFFFTSFFIINA